jgi:hypothetical protein
LIQIPFCYLNEKCPEPSLARMYWKNVEKAAAISGKELGN